MTTVTYTKNNNRISVDINGHAGFDKIGRDIVCAAASILSYTLRAAFTRNSSNGNAENYFEDYGNGSMRFEITVKKNHDIVFSEINAVFKGFELLEENYPEYIKTVIINADRTVKQV